MIRLLMLLPVSEAVVSHVAPSTAGHIQATTSSSSSNADQHPVYPRARKQAAATITGDASILDESQLSAFEQDGQLRKGEVYLVQEFEESEFADEPLKDPISSLVEVRSKHEPKRGVSQRYGDSAQQSGDGTSLLEATQVNQSNGFGGSQTTTTAAWAFDQCKQVGVITGMAGTTASGQGADANACWQEAMATWKDGATGAKKLAWSFQPGRTDGACKLYEHAPTADKITETVGASAGGTTVAADTVWGLSSCGTVKHTEKMQVVNTWTKDTCATAGFVGRKATVTPAVMLWIGTEWACTEAYMKKCWQSAFEYNALMWELECKEAVATLGPAANDAAKAKANCLLYEQAPTAGSDIKEDTPDKLDESWYGMVDCPANQAETNKEMNQERERAAFNFKVVMIIFLMSLVCCGSGFAWFYTVYMPKHPELKWLKWNPDEEEHHAEGQEGEWAGQ